MRSHWANTSSQVALAPEPWVNATCYGGTGFERGRGSVPGEEQLLQLEA